MCTQGWQKWLLHCTVFIPASPSESLRQVFHFHDRALTLFCFILWETSEISWEAAAPCGNEPEADLLCTWVRVYVKRLILHILMWCFIDFYKKSSGSPHSSGARSGSSWAKLIIFFLLFYQNKDEWLTIRFYIFSFVYLFLWFSFSSSVCLNTATYGDNMSGFYKQTTEEN